MIGFGVEDKNCGVSRSEACELDLLENQPLNFEVVKFS
jgi:hypothetical protein